MNKWLRSGLLVSGDPLSQPSPVSPLKHGAAGPVVALNVRGQGLALWQDLGPDNQQSGAPNNSPLLLATTTPGR